MVLYWWRWNQSLIPVYVLAALAIALGPNSVNAQINPDSTLNSIVTPQGNTYVITGGSVAGRNLFHSFDKFSLPTGNTAYFDNGLNIQNILTRVTGNSVSNIDGLIRSHGTANLFLLNPNGIIFGANASLNVGGSFVATTANAIEFASRGSFSASTPNNNPSLLTVNPSAFFFSQLAAKPITSQARLQVPSGRSLLFLGGQVQLNGGQLLALGGRAELAGVQDDGTIPLTVDDSQMRLNFPGGIQRADISLSNGAGINVRAGGGGSIAINAQNLKFIEGTILRAGIESGMGSVNSQAGNIEINALGEIAIADGSILSNSIRANAIGKAGNIQIATGSLSVTDGSQIFAGTLGQGDAGSVIIDARDRVSFDGVGRDLSSSGIYSRLQPGTAGQSGNINITAESLFVTNGAVITGSTDGRGNASNININVRDRIILDGVGPYNPNIGIFQSSGVYSSVRNQGQGNGGTINITTKELSVSNGAVVIASTRNLGNGGRIEVNADLVNLSGVSFTSGQTSGLFTPTERSAIGRGGNITVNTNVFRVSNGAVVSSRTLNPSDGGNITINARRFEAINGGQIITSTLGSGNAGNITLNVAENIILSGSDANFAKRPAPVAGDDVSTEGPVSGLFARTSQRSTGSGGSLFVNASGLRVLDGATVSVSANGVGDAGNTALRVGSLYLDKGTIAATTTAGDRGNMLIEARDIQLRRNSHITTNASGTATGGNIQIGADTLVALEDSDVRANAILGQGGNIQVTAQGVFLSPDSQIDASSQLGINGEVIINALNNPSQNLIPLQGNFSVTNLAFQTCQPSATVAQGSSFSLVGSGGLPSNPTHILNSNLILDDLGSSSDPTAFVEARGMVKTPDGKILLVAGMPNSCH